MDHDAIDQRGIRYSKYFLIGLAPVVALIAYGQIVNPNLSVAILAQNGVYALFSATFAPILFGIFSERITKGAIFAAAVTAFVVHFGTYYGDITMYANNPAVPATFALIASTLVAGGSLLIRRGQPVDEEAPDTTAEATR
jgi:SSS family solute:Na+ symporter/sodium/pantothenate symporter